MKTFRAPVAVPLVALVLLLSGCGGSFSKVTAYRGSDELGRGERITILNDGSYRYERTIWEGHCEADGRLDASQLRQLRQLIEQRQSQPAIPATRPWPSRHVLLDGRFIWDGTGPSVLAAWMLRTMNRVRDDAICEDGPPSGGGRFEHVPDEN